MAWIVQMPPATIVTVVDETVQTEVVVEAKLTDNPELAVALTVNGDAPKVTLLKAENEIVCEAGFTVKLWFTGGAAE